MASRIYITVAIDTDEPTRIREAGAFQSVAAFVEWLAEAPEPFDLYYNDLVDAVHDALEEDESGPLGSTNA